MPHTPDKSGRFYYGWTIVIASLIIGTAILGTRYSYGVFFKSIETEFALNRGATSAVFSAYMLLASFITLPWGWAVDRYGPRLVTTAMGVITALSLVLTSYTSAFWQVFVTYSLLLALGTAGAYAIQVAVISRWFVRKRGLALGLGGVGSGLGTLVMSPVAAILIASLGWRPSYLVLAVVVVLTVVPLAQLLKRDPSVMGLQPDGVPTQVPPGHAVAPNVQISGFTLGQALRTRVFWFIWCSYFMAALCIHMVTTHIVPRIGDLGISPAVAAGVLSMTGGTTIAGRVLSGRASDKKGRRVVSAISGALGAAAMLRLAWTGDLWGLYGFGLVFGLAWGGIVTMVTAVVGDIFGMKSLGTIMGAISVAWVSGAATGPLIGGYVFDITGGYAPAFLTGAAAMAGAALLMGWVK